MSARREASPRRNRTVRFSDEEAEPIERLAEDEGRSWGDMVRRLALEAVAARTDHSGATDDERSTTTPNP